MKVMEIRKIENDIKCKDMLAYYIISLDYVTECASESTEPNNL